MFKTFKPLVFVFVSLTGALFFGACQQNQEATQTIAQEEASMSTPINLPARQSLEDGLAVATFAGGCFGV